MIRVNYSRTGDNHKLSVRGHAGYDDSGKDIVCAGVSAISCALLGVLNHAGCDISESRTDSGEMTVKCKGGSMAFDMAMVGYLQIAKQYPAHITVCVESYIVAQGD